MTTLSVAREFSRRLLAEERVAATAMVRAWAVAFERLDMELKALIERMESAVASAEAISPHWLWRRGRLEELLIQAGAETGRFAQFAELTTLNGKAKAVQLAIESSQKYLQIPRKVDTPVIRLGFNRAPQEALEKLVGTFSDGSPLSRIFDTFAPQQSVLIQDALIKGVAVGKNPRVVAREVRDVASMPLNRALTISRTEQLRAHRSAAIENYRANDDAIEGWVWVAKLDLRTCPVCWAMNGTEHSLTEDFGSHPNCRCTPAPQIIGVPHKVESGTKRFDRLTDDSQLEILGPSKFEAYKSGRIGLDDLVARTEHPEWGPGVEEASLAEAEGKRRRLAA